MTASGATVRRVRRVRRGAIGGAVALALAAALACTADDGGETGRSPGAAIYAERCARCHGADGGGGIGPQLGDGAVAERLDVDEMVAVVTQGRNTMPAFGGTLDDEEIREVAEYVRERLGREGPPGGEHAGTGV